MPRRPRRDDGALLEDVSAGLAAFGLSAATARVFAWLLLSHEPRQTAAQLREATGLSAGAVSQATTMLCAAGLVVRGRVEGGRASWYEVLPGAWLATVRARYDGVRATRARVDGWLQDLGGAGSARAARLAGLAEVLDASLAAEQQILDRLRRS